MGGSNRQVGATHTHTLVHMMSCLIKFSHVRSVVILIFYFDSQLFLNPALDGLMTSSCSSVKILNFNSLEFPSFEQCILYIQHINCFTLTCIFKDLKRYYNIFTVTH